MSENGALTLSWTYGFSKDVLGSVQSLTSRDRNALVFLSSHSAIIYNYEFKTQVILQGHKNSISCCAVSADKRWIVTGDIGDESIIVIWDAITGTPTKTIFNPHPCGIISVDISSDAMFVAALTGSAHDISQQELVIYAWTQDEGDSSLLRERITSSDLQNSVKFDTSNQSELCTTGGKSVCFWNWEMYNLEGYVSKHPPTVKGSLTCTIFLPLSGSAVTSTDDGHVIFWESKYALPAIGDETLALGENNVMRSASKIIKVSDSCINCMEIINEYVAIGCGDGNVKFYDFSLRLEAWYEDVMAGPVTSLSFSLQESPFFQKEITGGPGLRFWAPDFIIGTSDAYIVGVASDCFHEIQAEDRRGTLLLQGMGDDVTAATCHPSMELLVIASFSGVLQLWDYSSKLLLLVRDFNDGGAEGLTRPKSAHSKNQSRTGNRLPLNKDHIFLRPLTLAFEPDSEFLVVGFSSGIVKFLNSRTLEDIASFAPSTALIRSLKFSYTGNYLGAYDSSNHVILFGRPTSEAGPLPDGTPTNAKRTSKFEYIGRYHSHSAEIVGIAFGESHDSTEVLISVSKDKRIVEYDCDRSSPSGGVRRFEDSKAEGNTKLDEPIRIELIAKPTAIMWLSPDFTDGSDDFVPENNFIVANDHFKFKEYIAKNKKCRKVVNSPTLGGYPTCLLPLPSGKRSSPSLGTDAILDSEDMDENTRNQNVDPVHPALPSGCRYYVYATEDHMIGIGCLPLSGNPDLATGVVAHPGKISCVAVSTDGKFIFSCGGSDLSVNMWTVNLHAFYQPLIAANSLDTDERLEPYLRLLDGGKEGQLYNDFVDYFFYFQLKRQGEDCMDERNVSSTISIDSIPEIMNAIGLYASEEDFLNMTNEIKHSTYTINGEYQTQVTLEELIKLYVNHRPLEPLLDEDILKAFNTILNKWGPGNEKNAMPWKELRKLLVTEGELMKMGDLDEYLRTLLDPSAMKTLDTQTFTASSFAGTILGFDDINKDVFDEE